MWALTLAVLIAVAAAEDCASVGTLPSIPQGH